MCWQRASLRIAKKMCPFARIGKPRKRAAKAKTTVDSEDMPLSSLLKSRKQLLPDAENVTLASRAKAKSRGHMRVLTKSKQKGTAPLAVGSSPKSAHKSRLATVRSTAAAADASSLPGCVGCQSRMQGLCLACKPSPPSPPGLGAGRGQALREVRLDPGHGHQVSVQGVLAFPRAQPINLKSSLSEAPLEASYSIISPKYIL